MPDQGSHENWQAGEHAGWGNAFNALPLDTPAADGWQRLQARLPAPAARSRTRWPFWLATAASLAVAAAIPAWMLPQSDADDPVPATQAAVASAPADSATTPTPELAPPVAAQSISTPVAKRDLPRHAARVTPSPRPARTVAEPAGTALITSVDRPAAADLEPLYAQSAQLEELLAMARDQRVASGTSAALSDVLDARVAGIDTALIQPGLSDAQRAGLWSRRVDALQQLVGIEATNRLYAARGQRYDAALVSID